MGCIQFVFSVIDYLGEKPAKEEPEEPKEEAREKEAREKEAVEEPSPMECN
jgi:hypothetical protein